MYSYSLILFSLFTIIYGQLQTDYYDGSCPAAEKVIQGVVAKSVSVNPGIGAGIIRIHFHDCFVRGCDGSILLDSVDGKPTEKDNPINKGSLRGFEVIDEAKALLEEICPETVTCADILAYAARDAAAILGGIHYKLPGGRRDGVVSNMSEPFGFLPGPNLDLASLEKSFVVKGLTKEDLVILSGAHSIGQSHCGSFETRIRNFSATVVQDPSMDPNFADVLKTICPAVNSTNTTTVPLDFGSPNRLDAGYYNSVLKNKVVFSSDQALLDSSETKALVKHYAIHGGAWKKDFAAAMIRMGGIDVLVAEQGQVRKNCRMVNKD